MASTGSMAQELMASAPEWLPFQSVDPQTGLLVSLGAAAVLVLWDEGTSFSFSLPGSRRRLGAAAAAAILGSLWFLLMTQGVSGLLSRIAGSIVDFALIGIIIIGALFKMRGR